MRRTNDAGVELIKSFEGLRLKAYQDSVKVWTIGYGHTGSDVRPGEVITEAEADKLLRIDLNDAEHGVDSALTEDVTDNQFGACVALAFNIGVAAFKESSIVKMINAGDVTLAADRFLLYNKAGGKVRAGLTRRRKAERALYLTDATIDDEAVVAPEPAPVAAPEQPAKPGFVRQTFDGMGGSAQDSVKEIAKSGITKGGNAIASSLSGGSLLSAINAFISGHWQGLLFAGFLILLAVAIWFGIGIHKHLEKMRAAEINTDKSRLDVKFQ